MAPQQNRLPEDVQAACLRTGSFIVKSRTTVTALAYPCGSCRTRLYSGSVSYAQTPLAFVGPDEVLPCCCRVDTDIHLDAHLRADPAHNSQAMLEPDLFDWPPPS